MSGFERTEIFIESLNEGNTEFLDNLEAEANRDNVPIIRKSMQRFLKLMLELKKPKNILEVGTAVGFSAILMAQYSQSDCHITTIEKYEKRIPVAKENFLKSGFNDKITLIEGDAKDILNELLENENGDDKFAGRYDMIFMDAAKGQYINFLPNAVKLLKKGGVLITDNVLQDDTVIQSKFTVVRRDRTIHKRMREYIRALMQSDELTTDILQLGDGISVSVKK
ncbi:MAG: O-methyltransferase [Lachnospiraceae bacterium]|jgi:predicted O-methyltransferase YrrM|nr:O-methyltransferase [Lachnospiraceae bacterium]MCI6408887.1 O-methyltransferase [Lachnospiraceae bacterium]MCI6978903.1 O-methyltransferase [Lachnospiraceae bacterium]MDD7223285.1 O-methyltransferase [Lachnospiraceae bacterium]MDY3255343.1 O-methyltransferase [Lachnospiraceae bacterium]